MLAFASLVLLGHAELDPVAFKAAVELYNRRDLGTRAAFEKLAATNPGNAEIQFYLGRDAYLRLDAETAVKHLDKAVTLAPTNARYHHRLGDAYRLSIGRASDRHAMIANTITAYETALELDPRDPHIRISLLTYYQEVPPEMGGDPAKALAQLQELRKLDPALARMVAVNIHVSAKNYAEAFAEFDKALKSTPDDYGILLHYGTTSATTGERLANGLAALQRCLAQTPPKSQPGHAAVHMQIGRIYERQSDLPRARVAYETALQLTPGMPAAIQALKKLGITPAKQTR